MVVNLHETCHDDDVVWVYCTHTYTQYHTMGWWSVHMRRVILTMQGVWFAVEKRAGDLLSQLLDVNEKAKKTEALLDELEKERSVFFHFVFIKCVCSGSPGLLSASCHCEAFKTHVEAKC